MRPLLLLFVCVRLFAADVDLKPLLLTPKRLKRIKLDHQRQTDRWMALQQRVEGNVESPERGVELAIYSVATGDTEKAHKAIAWTVAHPCYALDLALVESATTDLETPEETSALRNLACKDGARPLARFGLADVFVDGDAFLLSLSPDDVEHPTWQQHVAGLLLVNLDPNSRLAQFVQGWVMEDRFTPHDGPGVVYEFLYADPYLPGVSYQNMEPWRYRPGSLWARSDWSVDACWVHIAKSGHEEKNCPPNVLSKSQSFGNLVLLPSSDQCQEIPQEPPGSAILVTGFTPAQKLTYTEGREKKAYQADDAGLWEVPLGRPGKLCATR